MASEQMTKRSGSSPRVSSGDTDYGAMRRLRVIDEGLASLVDQGEIGFLPRGLGREPALVGTVEALEADDWIFPTPLDWPVALLRGVSLETLVHRLFGNALDRAGGRDMPGGVASRDKRIASASAPAATQLPHAVGVAWAAQQKGESSWALALFDGPEVDAPDFHTGLNFAGVMNAPVLFVCRVRDGQESAAEHAIAYGLEAHTADGADPLAVRATIRNARASGRPAVIELAMPEADPLDALRDAQIAAGEWDATREDAVVSAAQAELNAALATARGAATPSATSIVEQVYADLPKHLAAQRAELASDQR